MSIASPYYTHEFHGDYDLVSVGQLELEEGGSIPDCQLAVATWGQLNAARDNAILIPTWYSGTHQIWRDVYIGPEHALNPERYFIVAVNQIGIATELVNTLFMAIVGALALGLGLAFGLGGRDTAGEIVRKWYAKAQDQSGQLREAAGNADAPAQMRRDPGVAEPGHWPTGGYPQGGGPVPADKRHDAEGG